VPETESQNLCCHEEWNTFADKEINVPEQHIYHQQEGDDEPTEKEGAGRGIQQVSVYQVHKALMPLSSPPKFPRRTTATECLVTLAGRFDSWLLRLNFVQNDALLN